MAGWNLFIDKATGDLASEGQTVPAGIDHDRYEVRELAERPDWATQRWDEATRTIVDRPPPVVIDRLDEIQDRFLANPDFAAVWGSLTPARKTQLRSGILDVLGSLLGRNRHRHQDDRVELD